MRPLLLTLAYLLAGLGHSDSPAAESHSVFTDQEIVFGSFRDGDFASSIHAIRPDGSGEREISPHPTGRPASLDPWAAPDEPVILFGRGGGNHRTSVWKLDVETGSESRLTPDIMVRFSNGRTWPSIRPSHDGQILFVSEADGDRRLVLSDSESALLVDLGPGEFPSWGPDGSRLVYLNDDQVLVRTLASGDEAIVTGQLRDVSHPSWHPEGRRLLVAGSVGNGIDLFEIGLDGSALSQLTHTPDIEESSPVWSLDGSLIAFTARTADSADGWQHSLFVLDPMTGVSKVLTSGAFNDTRPSWVRTQVHVPES